MNLTAIRSVACLGLMLPTTLGASALWADVKTGVDAWSRGEFAAAIAEWREPAERGDADAQFNLGQAYRLGKGVPQSLSEAEDWFGRAAAQGHLQASDNFGLLLFQRGQRAQAMPYVSAAAGRGDPRAQYLLGLAHFNGDLAPKDWVRAYALVSMAQQAGLEPARAALVQMDQYIPLDQRQQAAAYSATLAADVESTRARQVAAQDLGPAKTPVVQPLPRPSAPASPQIAGADFVRPTLTAPIKTPAATKAPAPSRPPVAGASGPWRVQLGAFGVAANADALWNRLKGRPELAGHARIDAKAGKVTKLQAGGYATQAAAQSACRSLANAGIGCLAVRN